MAGYFIHPLSLNGIDVNKFEVSTYSGHDKNSNQPTKMDIFRGDTGLTSMGGLKVCAMASGKVLMASLSGEGDGMVVVSTTTDSSSPDSKLSIKKIRYIHLKVSSIQVEVGDTVIKGQYLGDIAKAGEEGYGTASGEHLHIDLSTDSSTVVESSMALVSKSKLISNYNEYINEDKYDTLVGLNGGTLSKWKDAEYVAIPYLIITEKAVPPSVSGDIIEDFDVWTKAKLDFDDVYTQKALGVLHWEGLNRITNNMNHTSASIDDLYTYGLFAASEIMVRCLRNRAINRLIEQGSISNKDVFDIANHWNPAAGKTWDQVKDLTGAFNSMSQTAKNFSKEVLSGKTLNFTENFYKKYQNQKPSGWNFPAALVNNNYSHNVSKDLFLVTGFHSDNQLPGVERDFKNNEILWVAPGKDHSRVIADTYSSTYSALYEKYR